MNGSRLRKAIAAGAISALVLSGVALAQSEEGQTAKGKGQCRPGKGAAHPMKLVHSESKVVAGEGFAVRTVDHGTVQSVSENRLTIKRRDDQVVTVTAGEETRVCRDGAEAKLSDIKEGDLAAIVQVERDGNSQVRGVRAFSEEFVEQRKQRREEGKPRREEGKPRREEGKPRREERKRR